MMLAFFLLLQGLALGQAMRPQSLGAAGVAGGGESAAEQAQAQRAGEALLERASEEQQDPDFTCCASLSSVICLACKDGMTVEQYCAQDPKPDLCPDNPEEEGTTAGECELHGLFSTKAGWSTPSPGHYSYTGENQPDAPPNINFATFGPILPHQFEHFEVLIDVKHDVINGGGEVGLAMRVQSHSDKLSFYLCEFELKDNGGSLYVGSVKDGEGNYGASQSTYHHPSYPSKVTLRMTIDQADQASPPTITCELPEHQETVSYTDTTINPIGTGKLGLTTDSLEGEATFIVDICEKVGPPDQDANTCGGNATGAPCGFPFTYSGVEHTACTMEDHDQPWCFAADGSSWGNCLCKDVNTCGGTANGAPCIFPFTFENLVHTSCTSISNDQAWCSTGDNGEWGNCVCEDDGGGPGKDTGGKDNSGSPGKDTGGEDNSGSPGMDTGGGGPGKGPSLPSPNAGGSARSRERSDYSPSEIEAMNVVFGNQLR